MTNVESILTAYMVDAVKEITRNYKLMGLRASGSFEKGLSVTVRSTGAGTYHAFIESAGHAYFMEKGRKSNADKDFKEVRKLGWHLQQWVKDKGIDVNPYAAAWKIVNRGIQVPNSYNAGGVISSVINDDWFNSIFAEISKEYVNDITLDFVNLFEHGRISS